MKISNLLERDLPIVEKKKIWFTIPAVIVVIAVVLMIVFHFTLGSALNIGMDFSGGYTMNVRLGTNLTDSNRDDYVALIEEVTENLADDNGESYGLRVSDVQMQGSGDQASVYVKYKAVGSEEEMEIINERLQEALTENLLKRIPMVSEEGGVLTASYTESVSTFFNNRKAAVIASAADAGLTLDPGDVALSEDGKSITVSGLSAATDEQRSAITDALAINDVYLGSVTAGDQVGASVSSELLTTAICSIIGALALMLLYIFIRFELSSAFAAIVALFHDVLIMFCFMAIFHIEINSTFIAAIITILGYSINNTIIIFDRVREAIKNGMAKNSTYGSVANFAVRDTLLRSINTSLTTLITIAMVAIIGVPDIRIFALPIIVGLLAGTFSSICIAPSIWSLIKDRKKRAPKAKTEKGKAAVA